MMNLIRCIRVLGLRSGIRYALGIAQEGIDFTTPGQGSGE